MLPWIEVKEVSKQIEDFQLGPISLSIEPGTITAFVGNNGSGKSALLKLVMNLANQMEEIRIFGKRLMAKMKAGKGISHTNRKYQWGGAHIQELS